MCSTILAAPDETITRNVNETIINSTNINGSMSTFLMGREKEFPSSKRETEKLLEKLDMASLRKAGMFLKEPQCRIFLGGFNEHQEMQLRRSIKLAGAIQVNELTSSVTHVIVNQTLPAEQIKIIETLKLTPHFVSLEWFVESMQMSMAVSESDFYIAFSTNKPKESYLASNTQIGVTLGPLPKSGNESVESHSKATMQENIIAGEDQTEDDIIAQYGGTSSNPSTVLSSKDRIENYQEDANDTTISFKMPINTIKDSEQIATLNKNDDTKSCQTKETEIKLDKHNEEECQDSTMTNDPIPQDAKFFFSKKFSFLGFQDENISEFSECLKEVGATIVNPNSENQIDFLIVPPTFDHLMYQKTRAKQVVSRFWLEDCLEQGMQLEVKYYHSSINVSDLNQPCKGIVIGITGYCGKEREFIHMLAEALGMTSQEIFAKRDKKGAKRSTHLICAQPEGAKYEAGIKWELPVITKDWLLACLQYKDWVSEKHYLVGDATKFTEGKVEPYSDNFPKGNKSGSQLISNEFKKIEAKQNNENFNTNNVPKNVVDYKTPKSSRVAALKDLETPYLPIFEKNKNNTRPINFVLTPDADSFSKLPPESQPSPSNLKRKRDENEKPSPYILRNIKTPETPYGAFLEKNPSRETRKFWKLQCDELGRFECTAEQRAELEAKKERVTQYAKEFEEAREKNKMDKEYEEYFKHALDPDRTNDMHFKTFKKYGVPILEQGSKTFEELMEEKMQKQGISWKNPKRFKLQTHTTDSPNNRKMFDGDKLVDNSEDNSKDSSIAAEQLSAQLAKFEELAQMNNSSSVNANASMHKAEEKEKLDNKSKRRSSIKMTLSSIEFETDRRLDIKSKAQEDNEKDSKDGKSNSDSQIRWVNPKEEEERIKLAARLALESQDISKENETTSEKNHGDPQV